MDTENALPTAEGILLSQVLLGTCAPSETPNQTQKEFAQLLAQAYMLQSRKGKDYGDDAWSSLGATGVFASLWQRVLRMKNILWDHPGQPIYDSFVESTLDLINWSVFLAILVRRGKWK